MKRVLSIDQDYFQDITKEQIQLYPDGIETSPEISLLTWAMRYTNMYPNFNPDEIKINDDLWFHMCSIIDHQYCCDKTIPVRIALSHADCYRFIKEIFPDEVQLQLFNVDMHHDMFNNNKELDCGNWINFVMREYDVELSWFNRDVSLEGYGIYKGKSDVRMYTDDLSPLDHMTFDAIFICRSDPWIPPHLDERFIGFSRRLLGGSRTMKNITYSPSQEALRPRTQYQDAADLLEGKISELRIGKRGIKYGSN